MKDAPAFDFYTQRWLAGTATMNAEERGAYIQLLCAQWEQDGLPNDRRRLAAVARCRPSTLAVVLEKFPASEDGRLRNPRLEVVRREQRERIEKSRRKIEKMNAARASTRGSTREAENALQDPSCRGSTRPSSPLTTHPILLEKGSKAAEAADARPKRNPRKISEAKALRIAEAVEASATPIPESLQTEPFQEAWTKWCQHRSKMAERDSRKPWTVLAAKETLRDCEKRGIEWAIIEIGQAIQGAWQGLHWDQRRNPADVRSQPMLPGVRDNGSPDDKKKYWDQLKRDGARTAAMLDKGKVSPGDRPSVDDIKAAKSELKCTA